MDQPELDQARARDLERRRRQAVEDVEEYWGRLQWAVRMLEVKISAALELGVSVRELARLLETDKSAISRGVRLVKVHIKRL